MNLPTADSMIKLFHTSLPVRIVVRFLIGAGMIAAFVILLVLAIKFVGVALLILATVILVGAAYFIGVIITD